MFLVMRYGSYYAMSQSDCVSVRKDSDKFASYNTSNDSISREGGSKKS